MRLATPGGIIAALIQQHLPSYSTHSNEGASSGPQTARPEEVGLLLHNRELQQPIAPCSPGGELLLQGESQAHLKDCQGLGTCHIPGEWCWGRPKRLVPVPSPVCARGSAPVPHSLAGQDTQSLLKDLGNSYEV